jgi:hypothetical protein
MDYQILAQIKVKDALREADKNRLLRMAVQSRNTQIRKQLNYSDPPFWINQNLMKRLRELLFFQSLVRILQREQG